MSEEREPKDSVEVRLAVVSEGLSKAVDEMKALVAKMQIVLAERTEVEKDANPDSEDPKDEPEAGE